MPVQSVQASLFSRRQYEGEIVLNPHSNTVKRKRKRETARQTKRGEERERGGGGERERGDED